jgi:hypothetical protein
MKRLHYSALILPMLLMAASGLQADARSQAKRIHDRLAGVPPTPAVLDEMTTLIGSDPSGKTAAEKAMEDPNFYNVTLKNWITPWTNEEQTVFAPLNDFTATVIGLIRDDEDFRKVLYDDVIYTGATSGLPAYSTSNNAHYEALEALGPDTGNLGNPSVLVRQSQSSVTGLQSDATAGVLTSRAAARAFFYKGTNRAMFRFTMLNFLCTDMEQIKDNSRVPDHVRRDVARSPGGDSRIYLNACVGCHAGMDGMGGAMAYYDLAHDGDKEDATSNFENTARLTYSAGQVIPKYLQNENNFKPGFVPTDDSWINYWRNGPNALLGWNDWPGVQKDEKGNAIGHGLKQLGMELAWTDAFAQCQVKKAFKAVCLRDPDDYAADRSAVETIVTDFKNGGYKMKQVFRDVAAVCKGN